MEPTIKEPCKNCGHLLQDRYCGHCGQKAYVERIRFGSILHEIFHFFTHIEHGFLFTSKEMLRAPGTVVTNFIGGQRKRYQPPVSYYLIWITIFIFTLYIFTKIFGDGSVIDYHDYFGEGHSTAYAISHLSIMLTLIVPLQAFYLYILMTHKQYNFFESMVCVIYVIGTILLLQWIFALIALGYFAITSRPLDLRYSDGFKLVYGIWFTISFLKVFQVNQKWLRGLAFLLLIGGTFTAWRLFGIPELVDWILE